MPQTNVVIARLYEHIEPLDRGRRYEDPLDAALRAASLGEVSGGGSQLGQLGEIDFAHIDIQVTSLDDALPIIVDSLQRSGAPRGSQLLDGTDDVIREFGVCQSVAVYLDGITLPDEVYANLDFDDLVNRLTAAAGTDSYHGFWQGAQETGLFFFGTDAETIFSSIETVLRDMPIGQNARLVVRPMRDASQHRSVRLARS
jgi:hypothetical protein